MASASRLIPLATLLLPSSLLLVSITPIPAVHAQTGEGGNLSNCKGGCDGGERCIGNPFSQPVSNAECDTCANGRYWWPCNFETLCYCNSVEQGAPRVPPAPKSRIRVNESLDPCYDILTKDVFDSIVQPTSEEGKALYTYAGLCNAIAQYNMYHDEKFAQMGTEEQMRAELAAFLAHTAVDTFGYSATREELHCVDPITASDGKSYCKPCKEEHYNKQTKTCSESYFTSEESYKEYCDSARQGPQGCACNSSAVTPVTSYGDLEGYIPANNAYFTRGALQISWNYDYYGASMSMTGSRDFLCDNPDYVSTVPQYAWGVGMYKWMEKMTFGSTGTTAHKQALKKNFGGTIKALWAQLECPANKWESEVHVQMVIDRVDQICKAGSALEVYLEMDKCDTNKDCLKCDGVKEIYDSCLADGSCPDCAVWTQFLKSVAPSVTPIRVSSPEDWSSYYGKSAAYGVGAPCWPVVMSSVLLAVYTVGSLFTAI